MASPARSSSEALGAIASLVQEITGVQLGPKQQAMIEARLQKRLLRLGLASLEEYLAFLQIHREAESEALVSLLTTHHTFFFREYVHFEYLSYQFLPRLIEEVRKRPEKKIRVWSAACSRGQEVYSLAMCLDFELKRLAPDLSFEILGTDVDPESVKIAQNGVYAREEISSAPLNYLADHWARGTGDISSYVKVRKSLRDRCAFEVANLIRLKERRVSVKFDVIFCRNVFIYFTSDQVQVIANDFSRFLQPSGMLVLGLSEGLHGLATPFESAGKSIYQHKKNQREVAPSAKSFSSAPSITPAFAPVLPNPLKVFCVDDSPTVLSLLKRVLKAEDGFEVVGTASHGIEAAEKLAKTKADVVTLDIHMDVQSGIEYLEKNYHSAHAPVVMVSSVSRESSDLAMRALKLGAADYVEKPSLQNLKERAEEIRAKLKSAVYARMIGAQSPQLSLVQAFARREVIKDPDRKQRVLIANLSDRKKVVQILRDIRPSDPSCVLALEGCDAILADLARELSAEVGRTILLQDTVFSLPAPGNIVLISFSKNISTIRSMCAGKKTAILVLGFQSQDVVAKIKNWPESLLLMEDSARLSSDMQAIASDICPYTSFLYNSLKYLAEE